MEYLKRGKIVIKLSKLKVNPKNPRLIKDARFKKLCENIKALPEGLKLRPIVIDAKGVIIAGNMRFRALLELGYKEVPDDWVRTADDFTVEQVKRFMITDNVGYGEWDWDIIGNEWDAKELDAWGLSIPVFESATDEKDPFDDEGITAKNQFGIIIMCDNEVSQEKAYSELVEKGYNCKIVVT